MKSVAGLLFKNEIVVLSISVTLVLIWVLAFAPGYRWTPEIETNGPYGNDFLQEWVGGQMVLKAEADTLYDSKTFDEQQHTPELIGFRWNRATYFPPVYPPPHYLAATILAWIPYRIAVMVWLSLLGIALIASLAVMKWISPFKQDRNTRWLILLLPVFPPIFYSILMGQKGSLWMLLIAGTWGLIQSNRSFRAGLLFGLVSIKPTLFFLLPLVLLRSGNRKFFLGSGLTTVVIWLGTFFVLPFEVWPGFTKQLAMTGNYAAIPGYHLDWSCNLMAFAQVAGPSQVQWLKSMVVLPLFIYVAFILFDKPTRDWHDPKAWMKVLTATMLISPHAYFYDLAVLAVPILALLRTDTLRAMIYVAVITSGIVFAQDGLSLFGLPFLPIILLAVLVELHLKPKLECHRLRDSSESLDTSR